MAGFTVEDAQLLTPSGLDLATFGQRLRHLRRARGYTLAELGERVGRAPSALSLLENGRREPKLSLIEALAAALSVSADELMRRQPPSRRAQLEVALAGAQRDPLLAELGNYCAEIERAAADALAPVGYSAGALSQGMLLSVVSHHGFAVRYVQDLPRSARSVTDLRNRRIYLKQESLGMHTPRAVLLQTLGHFVLGHSTPADFGDFLRQRVEANYFAAAVLVAEQAAVTFLQTAKR